VFAQVLPKLPFWLLVESKACANEDCVISISSSGMRMSMHFEVCWRGEVGMRME
jgi:hypothetical protein